MFTAISILLY